MSDQSRRKVTEFDGMMSVKKRGADEPSPSAEEFGMICSGLFDSGMSGFEYNVVAVDSVNDEASYELRIGMPYQSYVLEGRCSMDLMLADQLQVVTNVLKTIAPKIIQDHQQKEQGNVQAPNDHGRPSR